MKMNTRHSQLCVREWSPTHSTMIWCVTAWAVTHPSPYPSKGFKLSAFVRALL